MSLQDQDFPWVFRRDEIDILEDELEDLYETHHSSESDPTFESSVLHEQLDTQERSDNELSARLGFDVLDPPASMFSSRDPAPTSEDWSAWQEEIAHVRVQPLYQQARMWAAQVKPVAKRGYEQGGAYAGELFRIYANVNLVPLKIFTAMCEQLYEDDIGDEIALEEYRLALIYLSRIVESMSLFLFAPGLEAWIKHSRQGATALLEEIHRAMKSLPHSHHPL